MHGNGLNISRHTCRCIAGMIQIVGDKGDIEHICDDEIECHGIHIQCAQAHLQPDRIPGVMLKMQRVWIYGTAAETQKGVFDHQLY